MIEEDCNDIDKRVTLVEVATSAISKDIGDIKDVLNKMAVSLQSLAVWEERHANMIDTLKRAFKAIEKMELRVDAVEVQVDCIEKNIVPLKIAVETLTTKIEGIDPYMSDIKRSSGWVYNTVLTLIGIEGIALLGSVVYFLLHKG